jgi:protein-S-isoprenylcysteine O-methyltransferase Ste14
MTRSSHTDKLERQLPPPLVAALSLLGGLLLQRYLRAPRLIPGFVARPIGTASAAAGLGVGAWAVSLFLRKRTTVHPGGNPVALVTGGPYRFSRNPMYLGTALILVAVALRNGSLPVLLAPLAYITAMERGQIPSEERRLNTHFGERYRDYRRRVHRWM